MQDGVVCGPLPVLADYLVSDSRDSRILILCRVSPSALSVPHSWFGEVGTRRVDAKALVMQVDDLFSLHALLLSVKGTRHCIVRSEPKNSRGHSTR